MNKTKRASLVADSSSTACSNKNSYDDIKLDVLTVLSVAAKYITLTDLAKKYEMIHNSTIPYSALGYDSVYSLLKGYPKSEIEFMFKSGEVFCKSVEKECLQNVTSLIKRSKTFSPRIVNSIKKPVEKIPPGFNKKYDNRKMFKDQVMNLMASYPMGIKLSDFSDAFAKRYGRYINFEQVGFSNLEDMLKSMSDIVTIKREFNSLVVFGRFQKPITKLIPNNATQLRSQVEANINKQKQEVKTMELSPEFKRNLVLVLRSSPEGILSYKFAKVFKAKTEEDLPPEWRQHKSMIDLMVRLPDLIRLVHDSFFYLIFPAGTSYDPDSFKARKIEAQNFYMTVVKDFFYDVLFDKPSGLLKEEILSRFEERYGEEIRFTILNVVSLDGLIVKMMDVLTTDYAGGGKVLVKLKAFSDIPESGKNSVDANFILKDCILENGYTYHTPDLPESFHVVISDADISGIFYFQFHSSIHELDDCMDSLQSFYESKLGQNYIVPDSLLKVGLMCACKYNNQWHRCIVEKVLFEDVYILYVDYGTQSWVDKHELRFLRKEFSKMNVQALKGRLSGIKPVGKEKIYSKEAFNFFLDYTEQPVNSLLMTYDDDGVILLDIHYVEIPNSMSSAHNKRYGLILNNVMVERNFAEAVEEPVLVRMLKEVEAEDGNEKSDESLCFAKPKRKPPTQISHPPSNITKFHKLTDEYSMTLINLNSMAYIASCDLSSFFWDYDIAYSRILDTRGRLEVSRTDHPRLFTKLMAEIPRLRNGAKSSGRTSLTLFELEFVSELMEKLNHISEHLKMAVQRVISTFNPNDIYWTGEKELEVLNDELDSFSQYNQENPKKETKLSKTNSRLVNSHVSPADDASGRIESSSMLPNTPTKESNYLKDWLSKLNSGEKGRRRSTDLSFDVTKKTNNESSTKEHAQRRNDVKEKKDERILTSNNYQSPALKCKPAVVSEQTSSEVNKTFNVMTTHQNASTTTVTSSSRPDLPVVTATTQNAATFTTPVSQNFMAIPVLEQNVTTSTANPEENGSAVSKMISEKNIVAASTSAFLSNVTFSGTTDSARNGDKSAATCLDLQILEFWEKDVKENQIQFNGSSTVGSSEFMRDKWAGWEISEMVAESDVEMAYKDEKDAKLEPLDLSLATVNSLVDKENIPASISASSSSLFIKPLSEVKEFIPCAYNSGSVISQPLRFPRPVTRNNTPYHSNPFSYLSFPNRIHAPQPLMMMPTYNPFVSFVNNNPIVYMQRPNVPSNIFFRMPPCRLP